MYRPVLKIFLPDFRPKNVPVLDQTSKIHTRFQTCPLGRNYVSIILIRARTKKNYSIPFEFAYFSFLLSYSFEIETIKTFIHCVVPSKTIPDSRAKRRKNRIRWGGTYLWLYKGVLPPPPPNPPTPQPFNPGLRAPYQGS